MLSVPVSCIHFVSFYFFIQHWSGVHVPLMPTVAWPKERSVHAACALVDPNTDRSSYSPCITPRPSLFVFSGAGSDGITINDAWILDVNSVSWKQVCNSLMPDQCSVRVWY